MTSGKPLCDVHFHADGDRSDLDCRHHLAGQIRIVETIRVTNQLVRLQLHILAAERMRLAGREVREGHLICAPDPHISVVHLGGKAIGRQPLHHRIRIDERAVHAVGRGTKDAMQSNSIGCHTVVSN